MALGNGPRKAPGRSDEGPRLLHHFVPLQGLPARLQEQPRILHDPVFHFRRSPHIGLHQLPGFLRRHALPGDRLGHPFTRPLARLRKPQQRTGCHAPVDLPATYPFLHRPRKPFQQLLPLLHPARFTREPASNLFPAFPRLCLQRRDQPRLLQRAWASLPAQSIPQGQGLHHRQVPHRPIDRVLGQLPGRPDPFEPVDHHEPRALRHHHDGASLARLAHRREHRRFLPLLPRTEPRVPQVQTSDLQFNNTHRRAETMTLQTPPFQPGA